MVGSARTKLEKVSLLLELFDSEKIGADFIRSCNGIDSKGLHFDKNSITRFAKLIFGTAEPLSLRRFCIQKKVIFSKMCPSKKRDALQDILVEKVVLVRFFKKYLIERESFLKTLSSGEADIVAEPGILRDECGEEMAARIKKARESILPGAKFNEIEAVAIVNGLDEGKVMRSGIPDFSDLPKLPEGYNIDNFISNLSGVPTEVGGEIVEDDYVGEAMDKVEDIETLLAKKSPGHLNNINLLIEFFEYTGTVSSFVAPRNIPGLLLYDLTHKYLGSRKHVYALNHLNDIKGSEFLSKAKEPHKRLPELEKRVEECMVELLRMREFCEKQGEDKLIMGNVSVEKRRLKIKPGKNFFDSIVGDNLPVSEMPKIISVESIDKAEDALPVDSNVFGSDPIEEDFKNIEQVVEALSLEPKSVISDCHNFTIMDQENFILKNCSNVKMINCSGFEFQ